MKKLLLNLGMLLMSASAFSQVLYDNGVAAGGSGTGGMVTTGSTGSGGAPVSVLAAPATSLGAGHQILNNNRVADDFTVSSAVQLDSLQFFAYQTGSSTTSTITDLRVRIFNAAPNAGGTVVYGDTATNRLSHTAWTGIYRVTATTLMDVSRPIMKVSLRFATPLNLPAGTYWIEWMMGGSLASGPWCIVLNQSPAPVTGNAVQYLAGPWQNLVDAGSTLQMAAPFIVYGKCSFAATSSSTGAVCAASNGSAGISPTSGTAPYTYLWSNGSTNANISNLAAGNYTVTVSDAAACVNVSVVTVTSSSVTISTDPPVTTNASCGASNGTATVTPNNGTAPYIYSWSNAATTQTATGLAAGNYSVLIIDANGCMGQINNIVVSNPNAPALATSSTNPTCNAGSDGAANATVSGGTAPYIYLWSNGQASAAATGLGAGTYTVTVTDANSCAQNSSVTLSEAAAITVTATVTNVSCSGGSNGVINITNAGISLYLWSTGSVGNPFISLPAGQYSVTVTMNTGCTVTETYNITAPTFISGSTTATNATQAGANDGTVSLAASGGTMPYSFTWSNAATTQNLTGLAPGTYMVTITDANGCMMSTSAVVLDGPVAVVANEIAEIAIYPNPSESFFFLDVKDKQLSHLLLRDINGREIMRMSGLQQQQLTIDASEWASGVYFLNVYTTDGKQKNLKLVKK